MTRRFLLIILLIPSSMAVKAQSSNEQVWFEYMLNYSFANSFNLENAFTYSTLLGTPKWRALDYSATLEWSINQHVDLMAQTVISYTKQTESNQTLEIRPVLGTRLYFTPNKRIQTRLLLRIEQRNFQDLGTNTWTQTWRPRVRAESIIPINKDSYFQDKLWYAITDFEWLIKTDDVEERFANRVRWRIGGGYRFSYSLRAEFLYMLQQSKNAIDGTYESTDNIFRFRVKYFLRKTNPSTLGGTGN
jgi:hypothetical protein